MAYDPYIIEGAARPGRWCVTCDHASALVPEFVNGGTLGLPAPEMARHIAYDIGAWAVARQLARLLDSPAIGSNFSRLVIDPNRGADDPTLVMQLYDGTIIPGNRHLSADDIALRKARCYEPYHAALTGLMARDQAVLLSIHSFTPQLAGKPKRPWDIGVLYAGDPRLARPLIDRLRQEPDLTIGDNEPYSGHLPGDAMDQHALRHGRPNLLIELRNDLITDPDGQAQWAHRLAPILTEVLQRVACNRIQGVSKHAFEARPGGSLF